MRTTKATKGDAEVFKEGEVGGRFIQELNKAGQRLGNKPKPIIDWLLRFFYVDLSGLSSGDWENLNFEIAYLAQFGVPKGKAVSSLGYLYLNPAQQGWSQPVVHGYTLPSQKEVWGLQDLIGKQLETLHSGNEMKFELKSLTRICRRSQDHKDSWDYLLYNQIMDAFVWQMASIFGPFVHKIKRCPECQKFYIPIRSTKSFCGVRCQNRVAKRKQKA